MSGCKGCLDPNRDRRTCDGYCSVCGHGMSGFSPPGSNGDLRGWCMNEQCDMRREKNEHGQPWCKGNYGQWSKT